MLLISVDTLRADHVGAYGYERPTTPILDTLAERGVRFESAYAPSPWTKPSHGSMFTGLYPRNHGADSFETAMSGDAMTLAETLRGQGYATAAFVSNPALTAHGLERGFQKVEYLERKGRAPTVITSRVVEYLRDRESDQPFFVLAHYNDPHADYCARPKFERIFERPYSGKATGKVDQLFAHTVGAIELTTEDAGRLVDLYDAAIRQMDKQIGALLYHLEASGLMENTLVVLTSDHGEEFLDHGELQHGLQLFEESVRVPLILVGPGLPNGVVRSEAVSLVDLPPTIYELLGLETQEPVDGISLAGRLSRDSVGAEVEPRWLYFEASCERPTLKTKLLQPGTRHAIRRGSFKLHLDTSTGETFLYDLASDGDERRDQQTEQPELYREMLAALTEFLSSDRSGERVEVTGELLEDLQELGYGGDD